MRGSSWIRARAAVGCLSAIGIVFGMAGPAKAISLDWVWVGSTNRSGAAGRQHDRSGPGGHADRGAPHLRRHGRPARLQRVGALRPRASPGGRDDELDIVSVVEETPFPFANFDPGVRSTQESEADPGGQDGQIFGFEGFVIAPAFDTTIVVGTVEFAVTGNVATDGFDLELGLFDAPLDDVVDGFGNSVLPSTGTGTGTVNLIPQPGTASLLGLELGLLGPSASRRRQPRRGASITAPCRAAAGDPRRSA